MRNCFFYQRGQIVESLGTGKTFTVVKILALLQELAEHPLHIALAAPTGKAASRKQ
jgi:exodeoxyribonuclease V alpha subunit